MRSELGISDDQPNNIIDFLHIVHIYSKYLIECIVENCFDCTLIVSVMSLLDTIYFHIQEVVGISSYSLGG